MLTGFRVVADGWLRQDPAQELELLREGEPVSAADIFCSCERSVPLDGSAEQALDVTLTLHRGSATATGLLLRAWLREAQEGVPCAEVLHLDWEKSELQVHRSFAALSFAKSCPTKVSSKVAKSNIEAVVQVITAASRQAGSYFEAAS